MKKIFFGVVFFATAIAFACEAGTSSGWAVQAARIPYISAVNGHATYSSIDIEYMHEGNNYVIDAALTFNANTISTNGPYSFQIEYKDCSSNSLNLLDMPGMGMFGVTIVTNYDGETFDLLEPGITLELSYSTDRNSWTTLAKKNFLNLQQKKSLRGILFSNISLPVTLSAGAMVYFRLEAYPYMGYAEKNYHIYWDDAQFGSIQQIYFQAGIQADGTVSGSPNPGTGSTSTEVRVKVAGNPRPGRGE